MSWYSRYITSGKAVDYTDDMVAFCQEVVTNYFVLLDSEKLAPGWQLAKRVVDGGKYGQKEISVETLDPKDSWGQKDHPSMMADLNTGKIYILSMPTYKDKPKNQRNTQEELYKSLSNWVFDGIMHELVHMFDPSEIHEKDHYDLMKIDPNKEEDVDRYMMSMGEQNAYMRGVALERIRKIFDLYGYKVDSYTLSVIRNFIANLKPTWDEEIIYYKNRQTWQRYLQTLYHELEKYGHGESINPYQRQDNES